MNDKYKVLKDEFLPDINCKATLLKHKKSGARVVVIPSDDENKVFSIGFKTAPINSTGLTHILEHSVLCGSKKYPVKDPFVELLKSSLNTFLNAVTFSDKTMYPIASMNLKDYKNLMDVYLDAVFNPLIYKHEEIFMQEGWHYEIKDKKDPITINGVVYNEMKGAFSNSEDVLYREIMHSLYPDNCYGFESGGDPKNIPDLSYEMFLNFHKTFYSPSNSYIFMYGDCDMEERLDYLDKEYLSKYDYIESPSKIDVQKQFSKPVKVVREYPVSNKDDLVNKCYFSYNVSIGNALDVKLTTAFTIMTDILFNIEGAAIKSRLLSEGLCTTVEASFRTDLYQPMLNIVAKGCKEENFDKFKSVLDEEFNKVYNNGFNKEDILATLNYLEFATREGNYGTFPKGLAYSVTLMNSWLYDDNKPFEYLKKLKYFDELKKDVQTNYYTELINNDIINNSHKSYVILKPSMTIMKEDAEKLKNKLAQFKESLSEKEIENLIQKNKNLLSYQNEPDSKESLAKMPKLSISDINENPQDYKIEKINHNTYLSDYFTNNIIYKKYLFSINNFSNEDYQYIKLLAASVGLLDTSKYSYKEIDTLERKCSGGITTDVVNLSITSEPKPYFVISNSYLLNNSKNANDLANEIIFNTLFKDKARFKQILNQFKSDLESKIIGRGHLFAINRASSYTVKSKYFDELISGISYYDFLKDILVNFDNKCDKVLSKLDSLIKKVFVKDNLIIGVTSSKDDFTKDNVTTEKFISKLSDTYKSNDKFEFKENILNEAFIAPVDVNYCAKGGKTESKYDGSITALNNYLSTAYLWQVIRVHGGAYGAHCKVSKDVAITFGSYRDPNIKSTYEAMDNSVEFIKNLNLNAEDLVQAKIGAIGTLDDSPHVSLKGNRALNRVILNKTFDDIKKSRLELINASLDDLKNDAKLYEEALSNNAYCVIGKEDKINENKKLFKNIRQLF